MLRNPSYRIVLGMIIFAIILIGRYGSTNPIQIYMFTSIPAGWYVINRILDWIMPSWNTRLIIFHQSGIPGFVEEFDFAVWKIWIFLMTLFIKLISSLLIGWMVAPYFLYQMGRDITLMAKNRDVA